MYTVTLQISCIDSEVMKREFPKFILSRGYGKVKKMNLIKTENNVHRFVVDIFAKDVEELIYELEMICNGNEPVPEELSSLFWESATYLISGIPEDISPEEFIGVTNNIMQNAGLIRHSVLVLNERIMRIENAVKQLAQMPVPHDNSQAISQMADVVNIITQKTFGHKMIELDMQNNIEVKPKWLH